MLFCHGILRQVGATTHALQAPKFDLKTTIAMLKSLDSFAQKKKKNTMSTREGECQELRIAHKHASANITYELIH